MADAGASSVPRVSAANPGDYDVRAVRAEA